MAWEDRNGRSYYYRKEREGSRVRSVYVGGGSTAVLMSRLDTMSREEDEDEREVERHRRERDAERDGVLDALREACETLTAASLIAEGFHTHKRQWRRTRWQRQ